MKSSNDTVNSVAGLLMMLGLPLRQDQLRAVVERGLPRSLLSDIAPLAGLNQAELENELAIRSRRGGSRTGMLDHDEGERLLRFVMIIGLALELFESRHSELQRWLGEPCRALGGVSPVSLVRTAAGTEMVIDLIGRLEHGVII